ncbi:MAG: hypothetical protein K2L11_04900 [Muribaculaceae bacterium]|nr:hypothetical protein [Muribaculaceae bacterium]
MHNRRDSGPSGLRPVEGDLRSASCFSGMPGTGMATVDRQASGLSAWTYRMHPSYALRGVADLSLCSFRVSDGAAGWKACSPYRTRRGVDRQASGHREETPSNGRWSKTGYE